MGVLYWVYYLMDRYGMEHQEAPDFGTLRNHTLTASVLSQGGPWLRENVPRGLP